MTASENGHGIDLWQLYKSPEINRVTEFSQLSEQLIHADLAAAYSQARYSSPRRTERGKSYFVGHKGFTAVAKLSNRREEHLAIALFNLMQRKSGSPADALKLEILDYQGPLKAQRGDSSEFIRVVYALPRSAHFVRQIHLWTRSI